MERLCVIPCGKKKIWDIDKSMVEVEAKDAYIGTLHQYCQKYATLFFDDWVILSAKHGFMYPFDILRQNYDVGFQDKKHPDLISLEDLKKQVKEKNLHHFTNIVILGGRKHREVMDLIFEDEISLLEYPLEGCKGIGYMLQKLKVAIREKDEIIAH